MKYKILPHKADLKIRVFGRNKKELFKNALIGMSSGLRPKIKTPASAKATTGKQKSKVKTIKIQSPDLNALLVDFLSEVLYLTQVNKEIYNTAKFKKFSTQKIEAEISGKKVERFGEDIKAVTYHNLDIRQRENGSWEATILFDI